MSRLSLTTSRKIKLLGLVGAVAVLSACASLPTGLTAGAPSAHIPQSYEPMASVAAVTSTLGGSAAVFEIGSTGGVGLLASAPSSGSLTHDTGRLALDDGTYLFIDADGLDQFNNVSDGAGGAIGAFAVYFPTTYTYVTDYNMQYTANGADYFTVGVTGEMTAAPDMPSSGSAAYTGDAYASSEHITAAAITNNFQLFEGVSTVVADFGAGTATVNLGTFTRKTGAGAQTFDQIQGAGIVISGAHFTGGTWVTMLGGVPVDVVGASVSTTSNGTFFGYDANISAPAEVGGVVSIVGSTDVITGLYIAAGP